MKKIFLDLDGTWQGNKSGRWKGLAIRNLRELKGALTLVT